MPEAIIRARKSDVKTLSISLLKRTNISIKFKVRLYYNGYKDTLTSYHSEYAFNSGKNFNLNIDLNPVSYVQLQVSDEDNKEVVILNEVSRNKFIRKISNIMGLLETYESGDIDIIKIDSSGTHINNCFGRDMISTQFRISTHLLKFEVIIREDKCDIGIYCKVDDVEIIISEYDFMDFVYKIKSINFLQLSMELLNYLGSPELGTNLTDFRVNKTLIKDDEIFDDNDITGRGFIPDNTFDGLDIKEPPKTNKNNKLSW